MRINIKEVRNLMLKAHKEGYEPILTINGELYQIDYKDKIPCEADRVKREGRS